MTILSRNEEGTLVSDDEEIYVRRGSECGFSEEQIVKIDNMRRLMRDGECINTEAVLWLARQVLTNFK